MTGFSLGVVAYEGSSLIVVFDALRLLGYKDEAGGPRREPGA